METKPYRLLCRINESKGRRELKECRNDALRMEKRFKSREWNSPAYECHLVTDEPVSGLPTPVKAPTLRAAIKSPFYPQNHLDVALLYFAGHGAVGNNGFYLATSEAEHAEDGVSMAEILTAANRCEHTHEKIIILTAATLAPWGPSHRGGTGASP